MFNLDDKFLEELGLGGLPADEKKELLDYVSETLEMRVGTRLTDDMTDIQLDDFEAFVNSNPSKKDTLAWLETNLPQHQQLVTDELEKLKAEIRAADLQGLAKGNKMDTNKVQTQDLFKQLGLEKLADSEKLSLSEDLGGVALDRVANRLGAILTPEQASEFEAKLQTNEAAAFTLLEKFVPNYTSIAREEIELLRNEVVDTHAEVMKKLYP
jgi:hypothetical protein